MNNGTYKINWFGIITKLLLVALVIGILFYIIPRTNDKAFKNQVFTDNLNNMKVAAKDYFKGNKLPPKIGDTKVITLDKMEENKLLVPFTDYDEKACDGSKSYAEVTKNSETEYSLKVNLSCDNKEEYVLDSIEYVALPGTEVETPVIDNTETTVPDTDSTDTSITDTDDNTNGNEVIDADEIEGDKDGNIYEFEHRRLIKQGITEYVCPEGYERVGNKCYKTTYGDKIPATPLYFDDLETVTDADVTTTGSVEVTADAIKKYEETKTSCPEGYTLNNNTCIKYVDATVVPGSTTYSCENGGTLSGDKCIITINATAHSGSTTYSCPNGGSLNGTNCVVTESAPVVPGSTSRSCPNGGYLNGTTCVKTTSYGASASGGQTNCSCPSGGSLSGRTCTTTTSTGALTSARQCSTSYSGWGNPQVVTSPTPLSTYTAETTKLVAVDSSCRLGKCTYTYYRYTRQKYQNCTGGTQYCANGSAPSGGRCYSTSSYAASCTTTPVSYSCPSGGSLSGSTCVRDDSYRATESTSGSTYGNCPSGYSKSSDGKTCTKTYSASKSTGATTYTCPDGYTKTSDGTHCSKTYNATKHEGTTTYTCPEGYTKDGTTCYKTTDVEKEDIYSYSCPEGYTKIGDGETTVCKKTVQVDGNYYCKDSEATLVDNKCIKKTKGALKGYECPSGYIKEGTSCIKKDVHCVYPTPKVIEEAEYEYTWSLKSHLDGWEATGNKRVASEDTLNNLVIK